MRSWSQMCKIGTATICPRTRSPLAIPLSRSFHTESLEERQEWVDAYKKVQQDVSVTAAAAAEQRKADGGDAAASEPKKEHSLKDFEMQTVLGKGAYADL